MGRGNNRYQVLSLQLRGSNRYNHILSLQPARKEIIYIQTSFRPHLHCMVQVTQFRFFPLMWHRSDMTGERVSRKKPHGFRFSQIGFRPHSYVVINRIWIGYVHLRVPCKQTNRIFPSKCESYVIKKVTSTQVDTTNWDHMTYYRRDRGRRIHTVEQCGGFMSFKSLGRRDSAGKNAGLLQK